METRHRRARSRGGAGAITTVARGPKPIRALRDLGVEPSIVVPEPNTWREVLSALAAQLELKGKRVAVQEYGVSNHELTAGLEARGARVTIVPVYRWTLPVDRAPLRAALNAIAAGEADVAIFTSSNQVTNVMQLAEAEGIGAAVKRGIRADGGRLDRSGLLGAASRVRTAPSTSSRSIRSSAIWSKRRRRRRAAILSRQARSRESGSKWCASPKPHARRCANANALRSPIIR